MKLLPSLLRPSLPKTSVFSVTACSLILATASSNGQTVATTSPIGAYTIKVPGIAAGESQRRTYFGIQLLPSLTYSGTVGQVNGDRLTFSGWNSAFAGIADGHRSYVHVFSGPGRGFVAEIVESLATGPRCSEAMGTWASPGTVIRIRQHPKLSDLFGTNNTFQLNPGSDAASADNIVLWDPDSQQERVYYYHNGRNRWEEAGVATDAGNASVRFPYGLYIIRRSAGTLRISLTGDVASSAVLLPVRPGANVFSLPVNSSASLQLLSTTGNHAAISGPNALQADLLTFEEPTSGVRRGPFYHSSRQGATGWRAAGLNGGNATTTPLDLLSTLILHRPDNSGSGYILAESSEEAGAVFPSLPPDPEPNEQPLNLSLPLRSNMPPWVIIYVETSQDLQTWTTYAHPEIHSGRAVCQFPAGQSRAFYRLKFIDQP